MPTFRLGILLPSSNAYPAFADNLLSGVRTALAETKNSAGNWTIDLVPTEVGTDPRQTPAAVSKLYAVQNCNVVAGPVNTGILGMMKESLEMSGRPFISTTVGANIARPADGPKNLFRVSLGYWQSFFALAQWAAETLGRRAYIATTLLEAGYDSNGAFYKGFSSAGGSEYRFCVADAPDFNLHTEPLITDLRKYEPMFLIVNAVGTKAIEMLAALSGSGALAEQPVISSGYFCEMPWVQRMGDAAVGIRSCSSWAASLDLPENRKFADAYLQQTGRPPDSIAVLGYETGKLIAIAIEKAGADADDPETLMNAMDSVELIGPRGKATMDAESRVLGGPLYLRQVVKTGKKFGYEILASLPSPPERDPRLEDMLTNVTAGWYNEHLCI